MRWMIWIWIACGNGSKVKRGSVFAREAINSDKCTYSMVESILNGGIVSLLRRLVVVSEVVLHDCAHDSTASLNLYRMVW